MRVLILCAGEATRWEGYLGVPKQLAPVDGEPIVHRTVRLLRRYAPDAEVLIVSKPGQEKLWEPAGADQVVTARLDPRNHEADRFRSSRHLWSPTTRTLILYGDVFFSDEAMRRIATDKDPRWRVYGRPHASRHTGTMHGEIFALSWRPSQHAEVDDRLGYVIGLRRRGIINRALGWELFRALLGRTGVGVRRGGAAAARHRMTVIDDMTEDFDKPKNYDAWMMRWRARRAAAKPVHRVRLSVAVMAHSSRREAAEKLAAQLDATIVWDDGSGEWATGAAAWRTHHPDATHHLVVQDDAILPQGLLPAVEQAAVRLPGDDLLSLYYGWTDRGARRPANFGTIQRGASEAKRRSAAWLLVPGAVWGVALLAPVAAIGPMLAWCAGRREPYDMRIDNWCKATGRNLWHTWPSLVDHADGPSIVRPGRAAGRRAWQFIGAEAVALEGWDPDGVVVKLGTLQRPSSIDRGRSVPSRPRPPAPASETRMTDKPRLHDPLRQRQQKLDTYLSHRRGQQQRVTTNVAAMHQQTGAAHATSTGEPAGLFGRAPLPDNTGEEQEPPGAGDNAETGTPMGNSGSVPSIPEPDADEGSGVGQPTDTTPAEDAPDDTGHADLIPPPVRGAGSGTAAWLEYRLAQGYQREAIGHLSRTDLINLGGEADGAA